MTDSRRLIAFDISCPLQGVRCNSTCSILQLAAAAGSVATSVRPTPTVRASDGEAGAEGDGFDVAAEKLEGRERGAIDAGAVPGAHGILTLLKLGGP